MSYRQRMKGTPLPTEAAYEQFEVEKDFAHVFGSTAGQRVLDFIVQRICGVDTIVTNCPPERALEVLTRKNVGLEISRLALSKPKDATTVKVNI